MERVLRGEEISRLTDVACRLDGTRFYYPVRHHSPACSFHLKKVIAAYKPDCILIEGPDSACDLIGDMTDPGTEAPFCIYYSYRDRKGLINEMAEDYRCYYPFLDTSPELVALREGKALGATLRFIDLPYEEILIAESEGKGLRRQEEKNSYNDDRYLTENAFLKGVVERSGLRSFEEFWEQHFEMEGLRKDTEEFLRDVLHYCVLSRANTDPVTMREDGCLAREAYMREQIEKAGKKYQRILVVTGGFHVAGLVGPEAWLWKDGRRAAGMADAENREAIGGEPVEMPEAIGGEPVEMPEAIDGEPVEMPEAVGGDLFGTQVPEGLIASLPSQKLHSIDDKDKGTYLMSYSMEAADLLNGYNSGMPHPMFYHRIWEGMQRESVACAKDAASEQADPSEVYRQTILQFLVEVGKRVRQKEGYPSTFDEICAMTMCTNLAALRGKPFPGVYELCDAVLSNYVKGEYQLATDRPMRVLRERLTGNRIGKLSENAKLPPLCGDFERLCHAYRLDVHASVKKELTLSPFAKKRHREISAFLCRMEFLNTGFGLRKKGPNLRLRKDRNLIREIWEYHYRPQVTSVLIESAMYGGTIEEACKALADKGFEEETDAGAASELIIRMFEMDLTIGETKSLTKLREIIQSCEDFFSLTKTFSNLIMLMEMQELYGYEMDLAPLRDLVIQKLLALLGHLANVKEDDAGKVLQALKELYRALLRTGQEEEQKYFIEILEKMSCAPDLNALLAGGVAGLLYAYGERDAEEVAKIARGYLVASGDKAGRAADFVRGLFYVARDVIFAWDGMIDMLDDFLRETDYEDFLKVLPQLRLAFSFFTPAEMDRLAEKVAKKYGMRGREFAQLIEVTAQEYAYGKALEAKILEGFAYEFQKNGEGMAQ